MAPSQLVQVQSSPTHAIAVHALAVRIALHVVGRHPRLGTGLTRLLLWIEFRIVSAVSVHAGRGHDLVSLVVRLHTVLETQVHVLQQILLVTFDESPQVGVLRQFCFIVVFFNRLALRRAVLRSEACQVGIG